MITTIVDALALFAYFSIASWLWLLGGSLSLLFVFITVTEFSIELLKD